MKSNRPAPAAAIEASLQAKSTNLMNTVLLFIVGLSLAGSGFSFMRFDFMGLRVHPYLVVIGTFFPLLAIARLHYIPPRIMFELVLFASLYFATTIPGGISASEGIKMFAAVATIITMAMLVRSWNDFVIGVLSMCLAVAVLAVKGLETDIPGSSGIGSSVDDGHRNTYSLFALPPILLGSYILVRGQRESLVRKLLIAVSIFVSALSICLNLNRSGWLGLAVIAVLIIREKSWKAAIIFGLLGIGVFLLITTFYSSATESLQTRMLGTQNSAGSDRLRRDLITTSIDIALNNPLLGVSPQELPFELSEKLGFYKAAIVPHNIYAHIAAGSGIPALLLMLHIGYLLWTWIPPQPNSLQEKILFKESQKIMRLILILWAVRGCFTHEIIYSPAFCMAIGMALGLELSSTRNLDHRARPPSASSFSYS